MTSPSIALRVLLATAAVVSLLTVTMASPASAKIDDSIEKWWQYDPGVWTHGFSHHQGLAQTHDRWHRAHRDASDRRHELLHKDLAREHRRSHFHKALRKDVGDATWYDGDGAPGACGKGLHGVYIAHKTWPCGSLVSIKSGDSYILAKVADRGPYGEGRIVDLSPKAFKKLAALSVGVINNVRAYRLER